MNSTPHDNFISNFNDTIQGSLFSDNSGLSPFSLDDQQLDPANFALLLLTQHSPSNIYSSNSYMPGKLQVLYNYAKADQPRQLNTQTLANNPSPQHYQCHL
jgi:hypothetical protein